MKTSSSQSAAPPKDHDSLKRKEEHRNDYPPPKIPKVEPEPSKVPKVEPHNDYKEHHGKDNHPSNSSQPVSLDVPCIPGLEHKLPPPTGRSYSKSGHSSGHHKHDQQRSHDHRQGSSKHDGHRDSSSHSRLEPQRSDASGRHPSPQKPSRKSVSEELEEGEIE